MSKKQTLKEFLIDLSFIEIKTIKRHAKGLLSALENSNQKEFLSYEIGKTQSELPNYQEQARKRFEQVFEEIKEMTDKLHSKSEKKQEEAREEILNDPLSVSKSKRYKIELTTGGDAYWLEGDLDEYNEPETAEFWWCNWFIPYTKTNITEEEEKILLEYAQQFYFDE